MLTAIGHGNDPRWEFEALFCIVKGESFLIWQIRGSKKDWSPDPVVPSRGRLSVDDATKCIVSIGIV